MKSRLMLNLAMLALIAILGLVIYLKPGKKAVESTPLLTLDPQTITHITLQNREVIGFDKDARDGLWRLSTPFAAPANQVRIGQLLDIVRASTVAHYPVKPDELAQFGLDKPEATLSFGDTVLQFGGTDPINMRRYVRLGDTLHLVDDNFFHHLTAHATDYVDKRLLPEGSRIMEIQLPGLKATRNADNQWQAEPAMDENKAEKKDDKKKGDDLIDLGELASAWAGARAIEVRRQPENVIGETIRIGLANGPAVEYVIMSKQPELTLLRKDLGLAYVMTSEISRELLNQPASPPPRSGVPGAGKPPQAGGEGSEDNGHDEDGHGADSHEDDGHGADGHVEDEMGGLREADDEGGPGEPGSDAADSEHDSE